MEISGIASLTSPPIYEFPVSSARPCQTRLLKIDLQDEWVAIWSSFPGDWYQLAEDNPLDILDYVCEIDICRHNPEHHAIPYIRIEIRNCSWAARENIFNVIDFGLR
jgi:hypothetical protein